MSKITVSIVGATGYTGNELLRILKAHPEVEVIRLTSSSSLGKRISDVCPHFTGVYNLKLEKFSEKVFESEVVFFALPHGKSSATLNKLPEKSKIIDLAGDFRISDPEIFERFYGSKHSVLQKNFIYGFPEKNRETIANANFIANPGCFACAVELAVFPFVSITEKYFVSGLTGSSGSGKYPKEVAHHPVRSNNLKAYKIDSHQHIPEIFESLELAEATEFYFAAHSVPNVRGILVSAFLDLKKGISEKDMWELLENKYAKEKQIRIRKNPENVQTAYVSGSNFCDISAKFINPHKIFVVTAIDNLIKGAAGNAVQNMNILFGLPEITSLSSLSPIYP